MGSCIPPGGDRPPLARRAEAALLRLMEASPTTRPRGVRRFRSRICRIFTEEVRAGVRVRDRTRTGTSGMRSGGGVWPLAGVRTSGCLNVTRRS